MSMNKDSLPNIGTMMTAEVDGLSIRYAKGGATSGTPILLMSPWPESIYSFHSVLPELTTKNPVILIDLPGFGRSQSRPEVMAPEAMGDFIIALFRQLGIARAHVVAPDVGTPAVLFAAAKRPELFESLVVGGAAMRADLAAGVLKDLIYSPPGALANIDGADGVKDYLALAAQLTPPAIIEDFRAASSGRRFEEAAQFVRGYLIDSPKLETKLSSISTPALIMYGKSDPIVPSENGRFLADRLPHNRHLPLDAGHRVWEEAATEYAKALVAWFDGDYRSMNSDRIVERFSSAS